jgi:hypothetical protein
LINGKNPLLSIKKKKIATIRDIGDVIALVNRDVVQALIDECAKLGEIKF